MFSFNLHVKNYTHFGQKTHKNPKHLQCSCRVPPLSHEPPLFSKPISQKVLKVKKHKKICIPRKISRLLVSLQILCKKLVIAFKRDLAMREWSEWPLAMWKVLFLYILMKWDTTSGQWAIWSLSGERRLRGIVIPSALGKKFFFYIRLLKI
jgi:hypothetical protein